MPDPYKIEAGDRCKCGAYRPKLTSQKLDRKPTLFYVVCWSCGARTCGDTAFTAIREWRRGEAWKKEEK